MKLYNWMKVISFKIVLGDQKGKGELSSLPPPHQPQTPKKEVLCICNRRCLLNYLSRRVSPCPATSSASNKIPQLSQWETITTLTSDFLPMDFCSKRLFTDSPPPLNSAVFLFFDMGTGLWPATIHRPVIKFFCYSWINPFCW